MTTSSSFQPLEEIFNHLLLPKYRALFLFAEENKKMEQAFCSTAAMLNDELCFENKLERCYEIFTLINKGYHEK